MPRMPIQLPRHFAADIYHILAVFGVVFALFLVLTFAGALPGLMGSVAFSELLDTRIVVGYAVAHTMLDGHARKSTTACSWATSSFASSWRRTLRSGS